MFQDLPEGQTHSFNDGCGEPAHNNIPKDQTNKSIECCEKCKGKKSEARGVLNRCEYILCPCHLSASKEECEHQGECYKKTASGSSQPFGFCKLAPSTEKVNYLPQLTPSCCSKCGKPEGHNVEHECLRGQAMECGKCHRTSVVVPLKDKCPFCYPSPQPKREEIRTRLTYSLPGGLKDFEWEVIINNVESLMADALAAYKSSLREKIEGMKRKKGSDDYVLSDQNAWYNAGLAAVLKIMGSDK